MRRTGLKVSTSVPTAPGLDYIRPENLPHNPLQRPKGWNWTWKQGETLPHFPIRGETPDSNSDVLVRCCGASCRANEGPLKFETDLAICALSLATKTQPMDPRVERLFYENERRVCLQLQISYKDCPPDANWFMVGEIDGSVQVELTKRVMANFFLSVLKCYEPRTTHSLGGGGTNAFIALPMDRIEPALASPKSGQVYFLETGACPMNFETWQILDVPQGTCRDLSGFWGTRPARFYIQAKLPDGTTKKALEFELDWNGHRAGVAQQAALQ